MFFFTADMILGNAFSPIEFNIQEEFILGCTDQSACNYNQSANFDDGSCSFETSFSFTHNLSSGNNLISLPGYLDNTNSQNLMDAIINDGMLLVLTDSTLIIYEISNL